MSPKEFGLASRLRLGLHMPGNNWITQCECGKDVDREGYHLLTCRVGGGPVWEHNIFCVWLGGVFGRTSSANLCWSFLVLDDTSDISLSLPSSCSS